MATVYTPLPLFNDWDYQYQISLEGNSYSVRIYYNERIKGWCFDLSIEGGANIVVGERLVPYYPILEDYVTPNLTGFIWLEPIGDSLEKFREEPENLYKWFRCFYIAQTEDN